MSALTSRSTSCHPQRHRCAGRSQYTRLDADAVLLPCVQLPFDYYSLPFCRPNEVNNAVENLGEVRSSRRHGAPLCLPPALLPQVLHGSVIQNSAYEILMHQQVFKVRCHKADVHGLLVSTSITSVQVLCRKEVAVEDVKRLATRIMEVRDLLLE